MIPNPCAAVRASFPAYLDGAVSGHEMQEISRHIDGFDEGVSGGRIAACQPCAREFVALRMTQEAIATLRPTKAPADLALKLRVAISREQAKRRFRLLDRISLAWDNAVRPLVLQITAGFAGSVVLVGSIMLLLGVVAAPQAVLANDEPLGAVTAPHYLYSNISSGAIVTAHGTAIVVEASIDTAGRVYDYTIVAGPDDEAVRNQVADQLLGSVFQPASAFGVPIRGRVIVTFFGISVRG